MMMILKASNNPVYWSQLLPWVFLSASPIGRMWTKNGLVRALSSSSSSTASSSLIQTWPTASSKPAWVRNVAVPGLEKGMDYVRLGDSDLIVSKVCMGTMTFGEQNTLEEGAQQLTAAVEEYGVNFIDTAEMYPVPTKAETQGRTDATVRAFLQSRPASARADLVLATKVAGRSDRITWLPRRQPKTPACLSREQILDSVEASLQRLGTDYIDLLQLHWPDRYTGGLFGQPDFSPTQYEQVAPGNTIALEETLAALQHVVQQGKVRHVGVSNETPFGVCSMIHLAKQFPDLYPQIVSIQNSYSLVNRKDFEAGLAEVCYHHNVGLLAYSPLAGGSLTGKYRYPAQLSPRARLKLFPGFMDRYLGSLNEKAVNAYCQVAEQAGLTPAQLALSWCYHTQQDLVASTIIGATNMDHLHENIRAYDVRLSTELQDQIEATYRQFPDPTKAPRKSKA